MTHAEAFAIALEASYEVNASQRFPGIKNDKYPPEAAILSDAGADHTPVEGHPTVTGHELVRRLDLANRRKRALELAIANTTALLADRMKRELES